MPIPSSFEEVWNALYNEVVAVHARWLNFEQLFNHSTERTKKLYHTAWTFFYILQTTLVDDVQLTLGRIGDPAQTSGRDNATLHTILAQVRALGDDAFTQAVQDKLHAYQQACIDLRTRRNKLIAHYDRTALLQQFASSSGASATPPDISQPTKEEIKGALNALANFMNLIERHYTDTSTAYHLFRRQEDAGSLVWMIKFGMRYQELLKSGVIEHEYINKLDEYRW